MSTEDTSEASSAQNNRLMKAKAPTLGNVGALIIRIGFCGVPYYDCSIIYPQTIF